MNSKERVFTALSHREPDMVPIDFWATGEVKEGLKNYFKLSTEEELLQKVGCDFRGIPCPYREPARTPEGFLVDHWGVKRKLVSFGEGQYQGTYSEVVESPLEFATTLQEIENYDGWPSTEWLQEVDFSFDEEKYSGYATVLSPDRLDRTAQFKPAMYLRGVQKLLMDMAANPPMAEAIFDRVAQYYLDYNAKVFPHFQDQADIFLMGDDFGMQNQLLISPSMWRRYFKENFRRFIEQAHSHGFKVMHHTCGSVRDLIPDFIECGLDILQSIQPNAKGMELKELKEEYGNHIAFHGSVCIQEVLPHGSPQDVHSMVKRQMEVGKPGGGFIICTSHNIQADTPIENILELVDAYHQYRNY